ncbi:hypothetical protein Csa_023658, partial [Cucumis sativus]
GASVAKFIQKQRSSPTKNIAHLIGFLFTPSEGAKSGLIFLSVIFFAPSSLVIMRIFAIFFAHFFSSLGLLRLIMGICSMTKARRQVRRRNEICVA